MQILSLLLGNSTPTLTPSFAPVFIRNILFGVTKSIILSNIQPSIYSTELKTCIDYAKVHVQLYKLPNDFLVLDWSYMVLPKSLHFLVLHFTHRKKSHQSAVTLTINICSTVNGQNMTVSIPSVQYNKWWVVWLVIDGQLDWLI